MTTYNAILIGGPKHGHCMGVYGSKQYINFMIAPEPWQRWGNPNAVPMHPKDFKQVVYEYKRDVDGYRVYEVVK